MTQYPILYPDHALPIGLIDPALPALDDGDRALFGSITARCKFEPGSIFLNPAPLNNGDRWKASKSTVFKAGVIYDFITHDFAGLVNDEDTFRQIELNTQNLRNYHLLLPISEYTARRSRDLVDPDIALTVTGVAVHEPFFHPGPLDLPRALQGRRFFVCPAGDNRRKNLKLAIESFFAAGIEGSVLAVLGNYDFQAQQRVRNSIEGFTDADWARIVYLPYLSDEIIATIFKAALAVVVPSFIEGFSMPVVEAVASSALVFASDCDAHLELIDGPFFSPTDRDGLAALMVRSATDEAWRAETIARQAGRADRFETAVVARAAWTAIFDEAAGFAPVAVAAPKPGDRPKILFVTPYPPEPTGVGKLHLTGMPAFLEAADVTVATKVAPLHPGSRTEARVIRPDQIDFAEYQRVFFVIGNSLFHDFAYDLLLEHGGDVILHDSRMFEFILARYGIDTVIEHARHELGRPVSRDDVETWARDRRKLPIPMIGAIIDAADRLYVFSEEQARHIRKAYGTSVIATPLPIHSDLPDWLVAGTRRDRLRDELGFRDDTLNICTFGGVDPTKGCFETLLVIDQLRQTGIKVRMTFVGLVPEDIKGRMVGFAESLSVADRVFFTGPIEEDEYLKYLASADMAMQFRKAPFGQLSGALTECVAAGLPAIANESLAAAHAAPSYIRRVPDALPPVAIALAVADMRANLKTLRDTDDERRRYLGVNTWDAYTKAVLA